MSNEIHPFSPIYDEKAKILILGTFPSVKSRENEFYYGHPQNRFWKVLSAGNDSGEAGFFIKAQNRPLGCHSKLRYHRFRRQQHQKSRSQRYPRIVGKDPNQKSFLQRQKSPWALSTAL